MMPWEFAELTDNQRSALIAMIMLKTEDDKKEQAKLKHMQNKAKR